MTSIQSNGTVRSKSDKHSKRRESSSSSTTTRIIILGGRSQHSLPTTEGNGMKIDRAHLPTLQEEPIFTITQWNTFCDTINKSLQIYNIVIKTHSKKVVSRLLILPMAASTLITVILIIFGRPFVGLGIFAATLVSSLMVCLYDRYRVDRAYDGAIGNLKKVVEKINEEGVLLEDCGVVLSVVLTGPTSSSRNDDEDDNDNHVDQDNNSSSNNNNNSSEKWRNNITNVYIECKRIGISDSPLHRDDDDESLERRQKQQRKAIKNNIVYNEEDASFSC